MVSLSEVSENGAHGLLGLLTGRIRSGAGRRSALAQSHKISNYRRSRHHLFDLSADH